jgi:hypothetical protein
MRANDLVAVSALFLSTALAAGCGSSSGTGDLVNGDGPDAGGSPGTTGSGDDSGATVGPSNPPPPPPGGGTDAGSPPPGTGDDAGPTGGGDAGSNGDSSATSDAASGFVPAPHPAFPLLVTSGGAVLTSPQVLPVFFSNYDITAKMTQLVAGLPTATLANGDSYWSTSVSEYGVGPLTVLPAVTVAQSAPTTDTDPVAFIQGQLATAPFKNVTPSTIIAVFYPSTTPLGGSCAATTPGYGGYHDAFTNGSAQQPYAVMAECANFGPITNAVDMVSVAVSHEIIEAATDPYPSSSPAYVGLDLSPAGFTMGVFLQGNAENGDMCAINAGFGRGPAAFPFLMQRGWSNKAAKAGNLDPCSPDVRPSQPFVGAYPVMPDTVTVPMAGTGEGVIIPVGQSKTVEVDLFSFEPTADFNVLARQSSAVNPPTLTFTWDKTSGKNGDKLHLTIKSVTAGSAGYDTFIIVTSLPGTTDTQKPAWAGIVTH